MAQIASRNLTIGKGQVFAARHATAEPTAPAQGYRDFGNAPAFSIAVNSETISHYSSRGGVRVKDDETIIEINRTGTLQIDDMDPKNLAIYFLGEELSVTASSATGTTNTFTNVEKGRSYQLGVVLPGAPSGARNVTVTAVATVTGSTALVLGTDYEVDAERGFVTLLPGGSVVTTGNAAAGVTVTFNTAASTRRQIIAGGTEFVGSLQFHAYNPKGARLDYFFPLVKLRPSGDLALISEEYMSASFEFEALALGSLAPLYINGIAS